VPSPTHVTVAHVCFAIPGRTRWEVPCCLDRPDVAQRIESTLATTSGVSSVTANPVTGRVLVVHDRRLSSESLEPRLLGAVAAAMCGAGSVTQLAAAPARSPSRTIGAVAKDHRSSIAIALGVAVVDRFFEAAPSAMIGAAGDIVTKRGDSWLGALMQRSVRGQLMALAAIGTVVWTLDSLMSYLHTLTTGDLAREIQQDLRSRAFRHVQTLDIAQLEAKPINDWVGLVRSDAGRIAHFIEEGIDPFVLMVTNAITVTGTFLINSPGLALALLLVLPGLYFVSSRLLTPIRERHESARLDEDRLNAALLGNLEGMSTIVGYGKQEFEAERITGLGEAALDSSHYTALVSAAYAPSIQMVVAAGFLLTLVWGGILVEKGRLSITLYNVMGFACLRLFSSLARMGTSIEHFQRTQVSFDRLDRLFDMRSALRSGDRPLAEGPGEIVFNRVSFAYRPDAPVLHGIDLTLAAGKTTAIVGATGAGKTTVQKLIQRFYDPTEGTVLLDGVDIREYPVDRLRSLIASVPQQPFLFDGTVAENIAYANPEASMNAIVAAARVAQADEFIRALPNGYDTPVGENGNRLSGGQRQRITIARAVLAARPVVLFDEACSAVDYETDQAIQQSLRAVTAHRTVVVIAHRLSTIRHAERIYVLETGAVAEAGTHDELLAADGLYASLWRIQTGEVRSA